jgi:erythromycin esterase-like protein
METIITVGPKLRPRVGYVRITSDGSNVRPSNVRGLGTIARWSAVASLSLFAIPPATVRAQGFTTAETDTAQAVTQWVRSHATPLTTRASLRDDVSDLAPIGSMIGEAPLVGLGEGTHGTREFYLLKGRLIKYLVSAKGFRAIAFEGNFAAVSALDDYVVNGRGTPHSALAALDGFNWDTEELIELLRWVRAYNVDARHQQKVRFYGIDVMNCYPSLEAALRFIAQRDSAAATRLTRPFVSLLHLDLSGSPATLGRFDDLYERLTPGQPDMLVAATEAVTNYLDLHRATFGDTAPGSAWAIARHHAMVASQRARITRTVEGWYSSLGMAQSESLYDRAGSDAAALLDFVGRHEAGLADTVRPLLTALEHPLAARARYVREMTQDERVAWESLDARLIARLNVDRVLYPERAAPAEWDSALQRAGEMRTLLHDFREFFSKPYDSGYEPRDPSLAENVAWVVRQVGPAGKVIVWAHDVHVGASPYAPGFETMGSALRKRFGASYVAVGTLFNRGGFQARTTSANEDGPIQIRAFTVGPAAPGSVEAVLAGAHLPAFALDLRHLPANTPVQAWFATARPARFIGNSFDPTHEAQFYQTERLSELFDIIAYIDQTTRARPTPEAIQRFRIIN